MHGSCKGLIIKPTPVLVLYSVEDHFSKRKKKKNQYTFFFGSGLCLNHSVVCVCVLQLKENQESTVLSPEEEVAEKLRQKKLQEEADMELAREAFGGLTLWHSTFTPPLHAAAHSPPVSSQE